MSRKRLANLLLVGGVSLVLLSAYLFISGLWEDQAAGEASALALPKVQAAALEALAEDPVVEAGEDIAHPLLSVDGIGGSELTSLDAEAQAPFTGTADKPNLEMTLRSIDGYDYIGWLELPSVEITLPIMADWDDESLKLAPTRHQGTTYADDLVIAGHNYWNHFRDLEYVEVGDSVIFTDMDGQTHHYVVGEVRILAETEVDAVLNSPWDLAIYSCKFRLGIRDRMVVFADRAGD